MWHTKFLSLITTFELALCNLQTVKDFADPPPELPPIPVFSFYNQREQDVWTMMGPENKADRLKCRRDKVTMDVDPKKETDYLIDRFRIMADNSERRQKIYDGFLSSMNTPKTKKDWHAGLDLKNGAGEHVAREFLLYTDTEAKCGVFYVTEIVPKPGSEAVKHGPMCLLRVKVKATPDHHQCRPKFYDCLNHTSCLVQGLESGSPSCNSITYICSN